jgi:hypothetical protein
VKHPKSLDIIRFRFIEKEMLMIKKSFLNSKNTVASCSYTLQTRFVRHPVPTKVLSQILILLCLIVVRNHGVCRVADSCAG